MKEYYCDDILSLNCHFLEDVSHTVQSYMDPFIKILLSFFLLSFYFVSRKNLITCLKL